MVPTTGGIWCRPRGRTFETLPNHRTGFSKGLGGAISALGLVPIAPRAGPTEPTNSQMLLVAFVVVEKASGHFEALLARPMAVVVGTFRNLEGCRSGAAHAVAERACQPNPSGIVALLAVVGTPFVV